MLIADDRRLVHAAFIRPREDEPHIRVVAEAGNGLEAFLCLRTQAIDLTLLDISMPMKSGSTRCPNSKSLRLKSVC